MSGLDWAPSPLAVAALAVLGAVMLVSTRRALGRLDGAPGWRRGGVLALNVLAWCAMAVLLAPPLLERPVTAAVTLVTEGADAARKPRGPVYVLGEAAPGIADRRSRLATAGQLALRRPDLEAVRVLGHGLPESAWQTLPDDLEVIVAAPPPLAGPVEVRWSPVLDTGETLTVTGVLRLPEPEQVARLDLVDPAGVVVDSSSARSGQAFALDAVPRAAGALTYRLRVVRGEAVLSDDPVDIEVRGGGGARLLVVQSAPSFETRQLTNWAADQGNPVIVHTRISRDRDLVQAFNLPPDAPLERTPSLLAGTGIAVVDGRRWAGFDPDERGRFLDAVRDGMGLLLLADDTLAAEEQRAALLDVAGVVLETPPEGAPETRFPAWRGMAPARPLPVAPWRLRAVSGRTLTTDEDGELLESWAPLGAGRVAVSLLRERHRWATSGERSTFGRYWARMLRAVGRARSDAHWLPPTGAERRRPGTRFPVCAVPGADGEEGELVMTVTALDGAPEGTESPSGAPEAWHALEPHRWGAALECGHAWPSRPGWHRLRLYRVRDGDPTAAGTLLDEMSLRIVAANEWAADRAERRQRATARRASAARESPAATATHPLSPWWPWALLLVAGGLLWLERRWDELG